MIEIIGWISTALVLIGYISNARGCSKTAMTSWIIGDIGWVCYDIYIQNISHLTLSLVIISINVYGMYRILKQKNN